MDTNHKEWNERQKLLRYMLLKTDNLPEAKELFLIQHAMVHSVGMSTSGYPSFEDELLEGIEPEEMRLIPKGQEHSIAWILFHIARIEDVTMNLLAAGRDQVFISGSWLPLLNCSISHTGNSMSVGEIAFLSANLDLNALLAYRKSVGSRTREIVQDLNAHELGQKTDPARLENIWKQDAVLAEAKAIVDYWSKRTTAGLLLMPPTRHNLLHLNEGERVKARLIRLRARS